VPDGCPEADHRGAQGEPTSQIILAAAAAVAREKGGADVALELSELTANRGSAAEGNLRFKVWPSRRDRKAFLSTMQRSH
jgi:hypothetical protein